MTKRISIFIMLIAAIGIGFVIYLNRDRINTPLQQVENKDTQTQPSLPSPTPTIAPTTPTPSQSPLDGLEQSLNSVNTNELDSADLNYQ